MPVFPVEIPHFQHGVSYRQGAAGYYLNSTDQLLGITNAWTVALWVKPVTLGSADTFFLAKAGANNNNRISITAGATTGQIRVLTNGLAGAVIKDYIYNNAFVPGNWSHIVFTWNGTTLQLYKNGVATAPDTLTSDNAGSMVSSARSIGFGGSTSAGSAVTDCYLHSAAIWNAALAASDVTRLFNDGNGAILDLRVVQPSALMHWWLTGRGDISSGRDYGVSSNLIDIATNALLVIPSVPIAKIFNDAPRRNFNELPGQFKGHKFSLDFPGSFERLSSIAQNIQISNAWTVAFWYKPTKTTFTAAEILLTIGQQGATANNISFVIQGTIANDPLDVVTKDSGAANLKQYRYNNLPNTEQKWQHIAATWDGTTLTTYSNGVAQTPSSIVVDSNTAMTDGARAVAFAANSVGGSVAQVRIHSSVIYSKPLSAGQITSLYNNGNGWSFDCSTILNLEHWWLFGDPVVGTGLIYDRIDTSRNTSIDPTAVAARVISVTSSRVDYPGL